jgi:6-phosphogluconolactonase
MRGPRVEVGADDAAVAAAVAARLIEVVRSSSHAPFAIALAGGSTPRRLYELLATRDYATRIPWDRVEIFFGDERAVPPDHADSNSGMVERALLAAVPVRSHPMPAAEGDADAYARLLRERLPATPGGFPIFDLILLGAGEDGHTASLFPGTAALDERTRAVVMNEVPQLGTRRMTLTYPAINAARRVWMLVTGDRKRHVVAGCLGDAPAPPWPIARVRPTDGELVWWIDRAAAADLRARRGA